MVKISSTGDIVNDDDARSQASDGEARNRQNIGRVQHEPDGQQQQQGSPFDSLNQRLIGYGLPRFNIGAHTVEPIVTVGFVLAGLFLGLPGLLLVAVLFFVVKMSAGGGGINTFFGRGQGQGHSSQGGSGQSQGHRLGNS